MKLIFIALCIIFFSSCTSAPKKSDRCFHSKMEKYCFYTEDSILKKALITPIEIYFGFDYKNGICEKHYAYHGFDYRRTDECQSE